jgi:hAT family C-terminal dimerisation region
VRDWWLAPEQQAIYPNLSKMALNLLSIPAMSAAPERLFSSCKITITDRRNKLSVKVILECLRSWYQVRRFDLEDVAE